MTLTFTPNCRKICGYFKLFSLKNIVTGTSFLLRMKIGLLYIQHLPWYTNKLDVKFINIFITANFIRKYHLETNKIIMCSTAHTDN